MAYKTLIAFARSEKEMERVLATTQVIANEMDNPYIIGVYSSPAAIVYADPNGFIDPVMFEMNEKQHADIAQKLKTKFTAHMQNSRFEHEFRITNSPTGAAVDGVLQSALAADLLIAGQPDPEDAATRDETTDSLVFSCGRPVVIVPYNLSTESAKLERVALAFNAKKEASRAAFDAIPLLKAASSVDLIWIDAPLDESLADEDADTGDTQITDLSGSYIGQELEKALLRHDIKVSFKSVSSEGRSAQEALKTYIKENRIDLLVMGAYSHSRLRELVFGGVTRTILQDMTVPTLLSR